MKTMAVGGLLELDERGAAVDGSRRSRQRCCYFLLKTPQLMDEDEDNGGVGDARRWPSWKRDGV